MPLIYLIMIPNKYGIYVSDYKWYFGNNIVKSMYLSSCFLLGIVLIIGLLSKIKTMRHNFLVKSLILIPLFFAYGISQKFPIFIDYHLMVVHIGIILLIIDYITKKQIFLVVIFLYLIMNSYSYYMLLKFDTVKEVWKQIYLDSANENIAYSKALIIYPSVNKPIFDYYQKKYSYFNKIIGIPDKEFSQDNIIKFLLKYHFEAICYVIEDNTLKLRDIYPANLENIMKHTISNKYDYTNLDCYRYY